MEARELQDDSDSAHHDKPPTFDLQFVFPVRAFFLRVCVDCLDLGACHASSLKASAPSGFSLRPAARADRGHQASGQQATGLQHSSIQYAATAAHFEAGVGADRFFHTQETIDRARGVVLREAGGKKRGSGGGGELLGRDERTMQRCMPASKSLAALSTAACWLPRIDR